MATLSKYLRQKMARALVEHRFKDEAARLSAESASIFHAFLDDRYAGSAGKSMAALIKALPKALPTTNSLTLNAGGYRVSVGKVCFASVNSEGGPSFHSDAANRAVTYGDNNYGALAVDGDLAERVKVWATDTAKLKEAATVAYREALSAIEQFGTAKRLGEGWPEAMPIIGDLIPEGERALPVVQVAELNSKFDLPPAEKRAA